MEQQEQKNMEAAQTMEEQFTKDANAAEDAHTEYFKLRDQEGYDWNKEKELWAKYQSAHQIKLAYLIGKMDGQTAVYDIQAKAARDPNDYEEDDKVPADPQEKDGNDASNY